METAAPEKNRELPEEEPASGLPETNEECPGVRVRKPLPPEGILVILAIAAAAILIIVAVLCVPYIGKEKTVEDPESLVRPQHMQEAPLEDPGAMSPENEAPEETGTEPTEEPTIPPERNPYDRLDFQYDKNGYLSCLRQKSYPGVDVSAFQGDIDWQAVKDSGIHFAMIRLGYRGYESGKLVEDEYVQQNLKGATEAGLAIGVYFFSQALNIREVDEEIDFMLKVLGDYTLDMPIVLDWEIPAATARTAKMDRRTLTELQRYFCQTMTEKGYTPMIYFNWHQSKHLLYLNELEDYPFWLALYQDRMTYPWKVEMWQYTCTGRVPGINGDVDINVYMPAY